MQQVVTAYTETYGNVDDINIENPVRRLGLVPQGNGDQVNMIEIDMDTDENAAAVVATGAVGWLSSDVRSMRSSVLLLMLSMQLQK